MVGSAVVHQTGAHGQKDVDMFHEQVRSKLDHVAALDTTSCSSCWSHGCQEPALAACLVFAVHDLLGALPAGMISMLEEDDLPRTGKGTSPPT